MKVLKNDWFQIIILFVISILLIIQPVYNIFNQISIYSGVVAFSGTTLMLIIKLDLI